MAVRERGIIACCHTWAADYYSLLLWRSAL